MSSFAQKYKLPDPLQPGATIGVIAPASAAEVEATQAGLKYLKNKGYTVVAAKNLNRQHKYLAGNDAERRQFLMNYLLDDSIDAIFCVRGGYGLMRIVGQLDYQKLEQLAPKIILGYSDITVLQFALLRKLGWITYSGPMVASEMGVDFAPYTEKWMWRVLQPSSPTLTLKNPKQQTIQVYRAGQAQGPLLPGCLSLVNCLLSSAYCANFQDSILVLEDIGETGYKLDRLLMTLKLQGIFDQISGLILGSFVSTDDTSDDNSFKLEKLLDDLIGEYDFPVLTNFAYGHVRKRLTLPVGISAVLRTDPAQVILNFSKQSQLV